MPKIFITRAIPDAGIKMLKEKGYELHISPYDRSLSKDELIQALQREPYDAVLCMPDDTIDTEVFDAVGKQCKIFANYAVGFDNFDLKAANERGILITNTPGVLSNTVAELTFALMLAISHRIVEADRFMRSGQFKGPAPMLFLGNDLSGKVVGIVGPGRIGSRVAHQASKGFDTHIIYYNEKRNEEFEKEFNAEYKAKIEDLLKEADYVSLHVPLSDSTRHLINAERLRLMKPTAYLINTSRGAVIDEAALVEALKKRMIKGAALDVFENEPALTPGLTDLDNVVLTSHIGSGTEETRQAISRIAAENIIAALEGKVPPDIVKAR